jgi:hypothetical protein
MAEVVLLSGFLVGAGYGSLERALLDSAEERSLAALDETAALGSQPFDSGFLDALVAVVNEYDRMLHETPLFGIIEANDHCFGLQCKALVT